MEQQRRGPPPGSGKAVARAIGYLQHYRMETLGALFALLAVAAAQLAAPRMIQLAVDGGLKGRQWSVVLHAVFGLFAIAVGRGLFNFLQGYLAEKASQGVAFDLRDALYARIQRLSFSYYDQAQTGQLLTRLTNDVEQVRTFVGGGVVQMVASFAMLIGSVVLMFWANWRLAFVALSTIVPVFWLLKQFVSRMGPVFGKVQMALARLNTVLQEDLQGLKVVRTFSGEAREAARYGRINDELRDYNLQAVEAVSNNFPFVNFCANLGTIAVVGFGGYEIFKDSLTIGELLAFNSYLGFLLMPIMTMGFLAAQISRAGASAVRVFELLDTPLELADAPDAQELPGISGKVEFKDVHFRYAGSEREVLRGVSFTIEPGQTVALLGTTGSGKSTIINLLPRFYDVTQGAVLVDGIDVRKIKQSSLRSRVGIVLQEALLFSGSVRDNIAYGRPDATMEDVQRAASDAQASEFISKLPNGYDTIIGEKGVGLSGGQRQRLAIARTLLTDPKLLILDDSTSAVDAETENAIQAALDRLMRDKKRTAFVIAQRVSTVRDADVILVLDEGKIVVQGTHDELVQSSALYTEILGSQLKAGPTESAA